MKKAQISIFLGSLLLSAGLLIGCQENPSSVSDKKETIKISTSTGATPSDPKGTGVKDSLWCGTPDPTSGDPIVVGAPANPGTVSDICKGPGPITLWGATPRCTNHEAPVCGCDGKTYINDCLAWTYDMHVVHEGACTK